MAWVFEHSPTKGTDRLVLLAIADSAEDDGTNAWPGVDKIAKRAGITRRGAQQSLARLEVAGRIIVEHQAGGPANLRADRRPNRYAVVMTGRTAVHPVTDDGANAATPRGESHDTNGVNGRAPYPSKASIQKTSSLFSDRFDDFYSVYPRHEGKGAARRAWEKRVKAGADPAELVAGAIRTAEYHAAAGTEKKFVPLPGTWLNGEREQDDLGDPRRNNGSTVARTLTQVADIERRRA